MKVFKLFFVAVLFFTISVKGQLSGFSLQVSKTDETCLGNGSLTFSVSNVTPGASILYKVYLLPDTNNPISVSEANYLGSLSAGSYRVVAIQALGDQSNSQQKDVTINNNIVPFAYSVTSSGQSCAGTGTIIVNTSSGVAASYEIIAGPVTRPLQSSNTFEGLPAGTYNIRAFDNCGVGKVKTYTLSVVNSVLAISDPTYSNLTTPVCDSLVVSNIITATSGTIAYPIEVEHLLTPIDIGGEEVVITQTYATGPAESIEVSAVMARYFDTSYTYELRVTDNCNNVFERLDNVVNPDIKLTLGAGSAPCAEKYLIVAATGHIAPFTVNFISTPDGFTPSAFNPLGTGPFAESTVNFGSNENPVPFGTYVVEITDFCGRKATESIDIEFEMPTPSVQGRNNGCFSEFGRIRISVPDSELVEATIIAAPDTYSGILPEGVSNHITSNGILALNNMPLGSYTIQFKDNCGFEYERTVVVPPFVERDFNIAMLPSCEPGYGTVRVRSGNGDLTSVVITVAPAGFGQPLPYDVSANIDAEGDFYMDGLPQGSYVFTATDICGIVTDMPADVEGYQPPQDSFIFTPKCGGFSVKVTDESNGLEGATFWLQKLNTTTGNWGHPGTGAVYTEGSIPNTTTGVKLNNNVTKNNLSYSGKFRIVKKFETFASGTSQNNICISVLGTFTYTDGLSITSAYTLACVGSPNDVYLEVLGHPVSYRITHKNGEPFSVDNGTNNVFTNLEPAEYTFRVEDACGNVVTQMFNMQGLPSIADATPPGDMIFCTEGGATTGFEFHLTEQNEAVLGPLHSAMYTITYHLTQEDADNGTNALPEYFTNAVNGQLIYVRLVHNEIPLCHGTTSFRLYVGHYPQPQITTEGAICDGGQLRLTADAGYASYLWSTGETTRSIYVTEPGTYTVIVEQGYGTQACEGFTEVEIMESSVPRIVKIDTKDWTEDENTITVYTEAAGQYQYSLDGVNYQEENIFTGLEAGVYQVYVKDVFGCGIDTKEVVLLNYPKFFTPNGDGFNERWHIKYSILEPNMKVAIFDRYGKLIITFGSSYEGWDGTLNGIQLPSTDYWFVVTREDGRELKGHFAMIR